MNNCNYRQWLRSPFVYIAGLEQAIQMQEEEERQPTVKKRKRKYQRISGGDSPNLNIALRSGSTRVLKSSVGSNFSAKEQNAAC
jgi:hypothetical protein